MLDSVGLHHRKLRPCIALASVFAVPVGHLPLPAVRFVVPPGMVRCIEIKLDPEYQQLNILVWNVKQRLRCQSHTALFAGAAQEALDNT